ncbi:MAG: Gfo/Idh/MocA family protein [Anaerolineae bacterium]
MLEDTYGHTPYAKAFEQGDVYGIGYDEERASRRSLRLAILGAGGVAQSKYLPAISRLRTIWEPVEVAAIAVRTRAQGEKVAAIHGCRWYANWRDLLAQEALDGALITGPDDLHEEMGIACLEAGLSILVEKPITRSLVQSERLCRRGDETGLAVMTVANKRYAPPYRRARRLIAEGPVRNPALFAAKFNLGYDYVDMFESGTIHLFDLTRFLMGDVATVRALGVERYHRNRQGYPFDNAVCQFTFASGAVGTLYTSASALSLKPWERVEVYGDHAWLVVEDQLELILHESERGPSQSWRPVVPNTLLFDEEFGGFMGIVENFCQVIRGAETPLVTGWDGHLAYELAVASHLSMARGGEIVTLPLDAALADREASAWLAKHRKSSNTPGDSA